MYTKCRSLCILLVLLSVFISFSMFPSRQCLTYWTKPYLKSSWPLCQSQTYLPVSLVASSHDLKQMTKNAHFFFKHVLIYIPQHISDHILEILVFNFSSIRYPYHYVHKVLVFVHSFGSDLINDFISIALFYAKQPQLRWTMQMNHTHTHTNMRMWAHTHTHTHRKHLTWD